MDILLVLEFVLYFFMFVCGNCIFSFLNVVIYRVPRKLSFVKGFSACPTCGHRLYGWDMIPILSWICLRGRCRYCHAKVSARYSLVELIGGILAVLTFYHFDNWMEAVTAYAFLCVLTVVTFIDIDTMEIPNGLVIAVLVIGLISILTMQQVTILERLIGVVCVSIPLLMITIAIPGGFGGGDIKLTAVAGILLGWKLNILSLFIAILAGGIYGMFLLATKRKSGKDHFAFGPFLCVGMAVALFIGMDIIEWYLSFLPQF